MLACLPWPLCLRGPLPLNLRHHTWPKFHHDSANTGQGVYGGAGSELSWTYTAPGAVSSAPVVGADGSVYFTCDDGYLYALTGGGAKVWSAQCNCLGASSPAVGSDGVIYAGSSSPYLYAYNPNGTLKWRKNLAARVTSSINISPSGVIYFGCSNGTLYAVGADSSTRWTFAVGGSVSSTPAIARRRHALRRQPERGPLCNPLHRHAKMEVHARRGWGIQRLARDRLRRNDLHRLVDGLLLCNPQRWQLRNGARAREARSPHPRR